MKFTESQVFRVSLIAVMYDISVATILVLRFVSSCVINFQRFDRTRERVSWRRREITAYASAFAGMEWNRKRESNSLGRSWGEGRNVSAPGQPTQTYVETLLPLFSLFLFLGCWFHVVHAPSSVYRPPPTLKSVNSCHRGAHVARLCNFFFTCQNY